MSDPLLAPARNMFRGLGERAPELLAVVTIVGMFLYAQGQIASQQALIANQAVEALQMVNVALTANAKAMTVLAEQSTLNMQARKAEHDAILDAVLRSDPKARR